MKKKKKAHQFRKNRYMSWRIQMNVCSEIKTLWKFSHFFSLATTFSFRHSEFCICFSFQAAPFFSRFFFVVAIYFANARVSYVQLISIRLMTNHTFADHINGEKKECTHNEKKYPRGKKWIEKSKTLFFHCQICYLFYLFSWFTVQHIG